MVTFRQTCSHIKADFKRRRLLQENQPRVLSWILTCLHPGTISALMYRLSRFCLYNRMQWLSNVLLLIEHIYAKNEISPKAEIGPGLLLNGSGIGIVCNAYIGSNCTFMGRNTISLGGMEEFDLKKDRFEIGDDCVFGIGARVIRPVTLATGTQVMPNSIVLSSEYASGVVLCGVPAKKMHVNSTDHVKRWNPIQGVFLPAKHGVKIS